MNWIAFKMLLGDRIKYIGMIAGVVIASFLMNQQLAIFWGFVSQSYGFIDDTSYPDLWVMDDQVRSIDDQMPLQDTALYRVRSVEGVAWAVPMFRGMIRARLDNGTFESCIVIGLDDATLIGGPPAMISGALADLRRADGIIVDNESGQEKLSRMGADGTRRTLAIGDSLELNDHRAIVVGVSRNSPTMQDQPTIYTTYSRALQFVPHERRLLTFVLVGVQPGMDHAVVAAKVRSATGLAAYSQEEFSALTFNYIMTSTGIPIFFGITTTLGFIVGAAIVALLFYMFTHDNLKNFGALKAMGTNNWTLMRMTLLQSTLVGLVGYGLGIGLAAGVGFASAGGGLKFSLAWWIPVISGVSVIIICLGSAASAIVKVFRLEPAVVFKG